MIYDGPKANVVHVAGDKNRSLLGDLHPIPIPLIIYYLYLLLHYVLNILFILALEKIFSSLAAVPDFLFSR